VAALLLALIPIPDLYTPFAGMANSLSHIAGWRRRNAPPDAPPPPAAGAVSASPAPEPPPPARGPEAPAAAAIETDGNAGPDKGRET
ncbi:MAG: hypothetical protein J0H21_05480, partial [Rhizobiales bacterium]|nr:hypothetical protein [Hyphomicrobiales bacterium]